MKDYPSRINRVMDYIDRNLGEPLTLEQLSEVACFSPYHFHRIFQSHTGERLFQYIQRVRLEKSALLLRTDPSLTVTEAGMNCGFTHPAAYSRAFKLFFGSSPSAWRKRHQSKESNMSKAEGNTGEVSFQWKAYSEYKQGEQLWRMQKEDQERRVVVRKRPPLKLVYTRYSGPYKGDGKLFHRLWGKLYTWAGARGLIEEDSQFLAIYHDDPELTDKRLLRVTIALSTGKEEPVSGDFGRMDLEGGLYAQASFRLNTKEYQEAWDWVYREWLPQSGYIPDDRPGFELFPREEKPLKDGRQPVDICIPLKAAP